MLTRAKLAEEAREIEEEIVAEYGDEDARFEAAMSMSEDEFDRQMERDMAQYAAQERELQSRLSLKQKIKLDATRHLRSCLKARVRHDRLLQLRAPQFVLDGSIRSIRGHQIALVKNRAWRAGRIAAGSLQ